MFKLPVVKYVDGPIIVYTRYGFVLAAGTWDREENKIEIARNYRPRFTLMHELCHWFVDRFYPIKRHRNRLHDWIDKHVVINYEQK